MKNKKQHGREVPVKIGQVEVGRATVYPDGTFDAVIVEDPNFLGSIGVGDASFSFVPPSDGPVVVTRTGTAIASGAGSVAVSGVNHGVISTGRNNVVVQAGRGIQIGNGDMQINIFDNDGESTTDVRIGRGTRKMPWQR